MKKEFAMKKKMLCCLAGFGFMYAGTCTINSEALRGIISETATDIGCRAVFGNDKLGLCDQVLNSGFFQIMEDEEEG